MKNLGFTLIEMIAVILILSIIAVFAVSRWPGNNINLNAQAQQLGSEIRRTQSMAMSRGQRFRINFSTGSYSITDISGTNYYTDSVGRQSSINYPTGITATWPTSILNNNLISFDGSGTPYTDASATVALQNTAVITLVSAGYTRTISISPVTGRVIIQ